MSDPLRSVEAEVKRMYTAAVFENSVEANRMFFAHLSPPRRDRRTPLQRLDDLAKQYLENDRADSWKDDIRAEVECDC